MTNPKCDMVTRYHIQQCQKQHKIHAGL